MCAVRGYWRDAPAKPCVALRVRCSLTAVTLENPFGHMAAGCTDLAAANKAALVVEQAARAVAKRSGAHNVGVAARRER